MKTTQQVVRPCELCQKNNPHNQKLALPGFQRTVGYPGED